jgi:outer membrane receptor for ferrienterochelin and colicin
MGFRVPGDFSEDAHLCASAPTILKSGELEPERSMSFSLALDYSKNSLALGAYLFRTNITDKVNLVDSERDGYDLEWENAEGQAYTQGFELSGGYEHSFYSIDLGYGFTDAQFEDEQIANVEESKFVPRTARHNAHLDVSLFSDRAGMGFTDGWSLDVGARLVGSMFIERDGDVVDEYASENLDDIVETDPYVLVDARINKRINKIGMDIYLAAENLTNTVQDRKEWDIADAAMMYAPIYGTTVSVGFKKDF